MAFDGCKRPARGGKFKNRTARCPCCAPIGWRAEAGAGLVASGSAQDPGAAPRRDSPRGGIRGSDASAARRRSERCGRRGGTTGRPPSRATELTGSARVTRRIQDQPGLRPQPTGTTHRGLTQDEQGPKDLAQDQDGPPRATRHLNTDPAPYWHEPHARRQAVRGAAPPHRTATAPPAPPPRPPHHGTTPAPHQHRTSANPPTPAAADAGSDEHGRHNVTSRTPSGRPCQSGRRPGIAPRPASQLTAALHSTSEPYHLCSVASQ